MTYQYRDGVFSASSPAPRYGTLSTVFENGSLGGLEEDAAQAIDPMLDQFLIEMAVTVSGATAVSLAKAARQASDINEKLALTIAAGYAASHFGLPQNSLLATVAAVCDTFVMTSNQRNALHQQALALYKSFVVQQKKGSPMSGVFRDGVLGSAFQDGVLGAAYQDGSLGTMMLQQHEVRDGSLGYPPHYPVALERANAELNEVLTRLLKTRLRPVALRARMTRPGILKIQRATWAAQAALLYNDTISDGARLTSALRKACVYQLTSQDRDACNAIVNAPVRKKAALRPVSGLGGCGCAGIGEDAVAETPFYKKPLVIGGAAVALGVVFYALSRK